MAEKGWCGWRFGRYGLTGGDLSVRGRKGGTVKRDVSFYPGGARPFFPLDVSFRSRQLYLNIFQNITDNCMRVPIPLFSNIEH